MFDARRRAFITLVGGAAAVWPLAPAQLEKMGPPTVDGAMKVFS